MVVDNKLKAEDELLLSCARSKLEKEDEARISSLLDNNLDWDYLLNKTARNRLRPLLYLNLNQVAPERVPGDVLQGLKEFFKNNARHNLMLTGELVKVMALLEDNGIKAVTYKGPVLAKGAYGNLAYREFGDVDVLIDKENLIKAKNIMLNNSYYLDPPVEINDSTYMKLSSEYRFRNHLGVLIEIKWGFEGAGFYFPNDYRFLFKNIQNIIINNFEIKTPGNDNEFLMLCMHSSKHNWDRLSWICDLFEFLKNKNIDWQNLCQKSKYLGVNRILNINMILLRDLFGFKFNEEIDKSLNLDLAALNVAEKILKMKFVENKDSFNLIEKLVLDLKKRDKIHYGIKDCFRGLGKASYLDYNEFKLPERLFMLYIFVRPFLLIKKYGKGEI